MAYVRRHIIPIINQTKCTISFSYNQRRAASMTLSVPKDWPSSPQIARSHIWNWFELWQGLAGIPVPGHSQELKASDFPSFALPSKWIWVLLLSHWSITIDHPVKVKAEWDIQDVSSTPIGWRQSTINCASLAKRMWRIWQEIWGKLRSFERK